MRNGSAVLLFLLAGAAGAREVAPAGQLPRSAVPLHYSLHLSVDPAQDGFNGEAAIQVQLKQAADSIWLHGRSLEVSAADVQPEKGESFAARYQQVSDEGVAKISFGRKLAPQTLTLTLRYHAPYNSHLEGLYKVTRNGLPYIVTQMEAISARYAFPGFDEPAFKTPYDLSLSIPEELVGIANTQQVSEQRDGKGWKTLSFATTLPLPTYLIALAVGPWDVVEAEPIPANELRDHPLPLRAIAPHGQGGKLRYALANTAEPFQALERYFGIAYPFDKLDLAAIPDFSAGAMENAGLITYRDAGLLLDETSPVNLRRSFYETHVHEMAHQWFGDLVTMPWWDDIWLNEAFATWMQEKITAQLKPEYRADLGAIADALKAMEDDGLTTARRVRNPIRNNGDIDQAFDNITYRKGRSVLAMFEAWIGEDKFREGIRQYIGGHARGNASADDLVSALAAASGRGATVKRAMKSFLLQAGIPLIEASLACSRGKVELDLHQSRYLPWGSKGERRIYWGAPVCLRMGFGAQTTRECVLLETARSRFLLDTPHCPDWFMPNADGAGYYRFQLKPADLAQLSAHAAMLAPSEQLMFADAMASGFQRGEVSAAQVLEAVPALARSGLADVATALFPTLEWMRRNLADDGARAALQSYVAALYWPRLQSLGYARTPGESEDDTLLRKEMLEFLALEARVPEVRAALLEAGKAALAASGDGPLKLEALDQDLLYPVLAVLVQEQGAPVLERIFAVLKADGDAGQRIALLKAAGSVSEPALAEQVRNFGLSDAIKIGEGTRYYYLTHFPKEENRHDSWAWVQKNYDQFLQRVPVWKQSLLPEVVSRNWCDEAGAVELEKFFRPRLKAVAAMDRSLQSAAESIRLCAALKQKQGTASLQAWTAAH